MRPTPYEMLPLRHGGSAPLYLIPFDKKGRCTGPLTLASLLDAVKAGRFTDVHVFSHGWNNIFRDAVALYKEFFTGYLKLRDDHGLNDPARYKPVLVGIIWPSTALVLPWEQPPQIAAMAGSPERDEAIGEELDGLGEVAGAISEGKVTRFFELSQRDKLDPQEARELADMLLPIFQTASDSELGGTGSVATGDILEVWRNSVSGSAPQKPGFAHDDDKASAQPAVAGLEFLDPRRPIQIATVLIMKDRAATVGALGVGPQLVSKVIALGKGRVHLIGHSYGAKVMLSALCYQQPPAKAWSLLLLQPAISYLCFGENVDGQGRRGGYRDALNYVELPILSTFSRNDAPLTEFFHIAVRRNSDLGELRIAAAGVPPNRFAALGGYGPGGLRPGESKTIPMCAESEKYPSGDGNVRIYGIDGSDHKVMNHGDVRNVFTEWAHLNLVSGGELP